MKTGDRVFVDTGAWIALAVVADSYHERAREGWDAIRAEGARLYTSIPVVLETFTYLDRRGSRELAVRWKESLDTISRFEILECHRADLIAAWASLDRKQFHKLGLVDATSFALMIRHKIRYAFAFDAHFATAGFRYV